MAVRTAFRKYLRFDGTAHAKKPFTLHFGERWVPLLTKLFTTEMVRTDDLAIDRSAAAGENGMVRASNALRAQLESGDRENEDRDYVEGCFGRSLYPPRELALIEQRLCTGNHLGCHLWFTRGETVQGKTMRADVQHLFDQAAEQAERNRADFLKNNDLYQSSILRLTEHIRNCMQVQQQPDAVSARQGHVDSQRIWRLPVLKDGKVFLRSEEENNPGFTVDLLLDGSASRLHCQETIAAQGYILARSLATCEIPVRVSSFCSLRGYTVVRILKDFSEKNAERKIFNYFAAGWNRDGLALRMAGKLLDTAPADRHLLILLTDASPDDSRKILPTGKVPLSRSYDGEAGVQDTAEEVRALRQQGVRVAAVFMGENASAPDARTIYGQDLVRIQRMDQLATAAGKLIQEEIRELSGSMCKYIVKVIISPAADIKRRNCNRNRKSPAKFSFQPTIEKLQFCPHCKIIPYFYCICLVFTLSRIELTLCHYQSHTPMGCFRKSSLSNVCSKYHFICLLHFHRRNHFSKRHK